MGSTKTLGDGIWRLLRSRSLMETAVFWIVLVLVYLAISGLAGLRGVGYTERVDEASRSIAFDLNPVLWLPDLFLHAYPPTDPVPFLLWWVVLAAVIAEALMVVIRIFRGGVRPGTSGAKAQRSRFL
ncbi:MAG: hypothetical protein E6K17_09400 [Methanobacteriota archaeon]|nr:MAG: hypothetical protein E6K17_09400 [Euryarchaeota archaeon]